MAKQDKYIQVAEFIWKSIQDKKLKPGDRIPSARTLMRMLGTTSATVSRGMQLLADKNIIVSNIGSGSYVAGPLPAEQPANIGMLLHSGADAYALKIIHAIHEAAERRSLRLKSVWSNGYGASAVKAAQELKDDGCCAILIPWMPYKQAKELEAFMHQTPLPTSLPTLIPGFERCCMEQPDIIGRGIEEYIFGFCTYFKMLGERRIVLVGPDTRNDMAMRGYLIGFSEFAGRENLETIVRMVGSSVSDMDNAVRSLLKYKNDLAVVCYDDLHALRFLTSMRKFGLSAPENFRIIGFNDSKEAAFCDPPLSSGRPDYATLGETAIRSVLALAQGDVWQASHPVANTLVLRESCGGSGKLTEDMIETLKNCNISLVRQDEILTKEGELTVK